MALLRECQGIESPRSAASRAATGSKMAKRTKTNVKRLGRIPRFQRVRDVPDPVAACSFCGKPLSEIGYLVGGGTARICEYCVATCAILVRRPRSSEDH